MGKIHVDFKMHSSRDITCLLWLPGNEIESNICLTETKTERYTQKSVSNVNN